jgi:hypothetical protein
MKCRTLQQLLIEISMTADLNIIQVHTFNILTVFYVNILSLQAMPYLFSEYLERQQLEWQQKVMKIFLLEMGLLNDLNFFFFDQ